MKRLILIITTAIILATSTTAMAAETPAERENRETWEDIRPICQIHVWADLLVQSKAAPELLPMKNGTNYEMEQITETLFLNLYQGRENTYEQQARNCEWAVRRWLGWVDSLVDHGGMDISRAEKALALMQEAFNWNGEGDDPLDKILDLYQ